MPLLIFIIPVLIWILSGLKVIQEYEAGVIFRLGKFAEVKRAGLNWIVPVLDRLVKVDLRTVTRDVPPQDVITRDNVSLKVSAVIYFRVVDAEKAVIQVENFLYATSQLAQTTLRSTLGKLELDDLLAQREKINKDLQQVLDLHTEPWGVKVTAVEVKQLDLPVEMQRAMAKQAEAERERRAKIIAAEGEYQAAEKLGMAADVIDAHPAALQLRYLQTLVEISAEKSSTTIFPVPIDLIASFMSQNRGPHGPQTPHAPSLTPPASSHAAPPHQAASAVPPMPTRPPEPGTTGRPGSGEK
jgi:regulator of protease activity HflC (stomatin/prohibitin superfamily)